MGRDGFQMTPISYKCLAFHLNKYSKRVKGRCADYGGAGRGGQLAKKLLASGGVTDHHALDYKTGYDLMKPIKGEKFDMGICMDLLEHTSNPFIVADNISNSLKKGALLFVTAPFVWAKHNHPNDYFRFSVAGLKAIFPKMKPLKCFWVTDAAEDFANIKIPYESVHWFTRVFGVFEKRRKKC